MQKATPAWLEGASIRGTHHESGHAGVLGLLMGKNGSTRFAIDTVCSNQDVTCPAGAILHRRQEPSDMQKCRLTVPMLLPGF